jgi:hypothetical protein
VAHGLSAAPASSGASSARLRHTSGKGLTLKLLGSKNSAFGALATASGEGR